MRIGGEGVWRRDQTVKCFQSEEQALHVFAELAAST